MKEERRNMPKIYTITISKQLAEQYGLEKTIFHETGENPPDAIKNALEKEGYKVNAPVMKYCTDNASMVASCAYFNKNTYDDVDVEVFSRVK